MVGTKLQCLLTKGHVTLSLGPYQYVALQPACTARGDTYPMTTHFFGRVHEVAPGLLLGPMPRPDWDLESVGVSIVVSLSEHLPPQASEKSGLTNLAAGDGRIMFLHWPIKDGAPPETGLQFLLTDFITNAIRSKRVVLLHCSAGVNRSALIAALVVRELQNLSGAEALSVVQTARPGTLRNEDFVQLLESLPRPNPPALGSVGNWDVTSSS